MDSRSVTTESKRHIHGIPTLPCSKSQGGNRAVISSQQHMGTSGSANSPKTPFLVPTQALGGSQTPHPPSVERQTELTEDLKLQ